MLIINYEKDTHLAGVREVLAVNIRVPALCKRRRKLEIARDRKTGMAWSMGKFSISAQAHNSWERRERVRAASNSYTRKSAVRTPKVMPAETVAHPVHAKGCQGARRGVQ